MFVYKYFILICTVIYSMIIKSLNIIKSVIVLIAKLILLYLLNMLLTILVYFTIINGLYKIIV